MTKAVSRFNSILTTDRYIKRIIGIKWELITPEMIEEKRRKIHEKRIKANGSKFDTLK